MKNVFTICILLLTLFLPVISRAQNTATPQGLSEPEVQKEINRPQAGKFGFNIFMSLLSNSEKMQLRHRGLEEQHSSFYNGLGMSLRFYFTDNLAARGAFSYFNNRELEHVDGWKNEVSGIRAWQGKLGLMLAIKGTDKLEPYVFIDALYGQSQARFTPHMGITKSTDLQATTGAVGGLGFNYYFAKNIAIGAEMGIGIIEHDSIETPDNSLSFLSGANGNLGISVFF